MWVESVEFCEIKVQKAVRLKCKTLWVFSVEMLLVYMIQGYIFIDTYKGCIDLTSIVDSH